MKKKILLSLIIGSMFFSGCTNSDTLVSEHETVQDTETETVTESDQRPTEPVISTDGSDDIAESESVSEEESAAEEMAKYDAVLYAAQEVMNTDEFINADDDQKVEIVCETLKDIALKGTEEYPESLVKNDSWIYYPESKEIEFEYFNGVVGCIVIGENPDEIAPTA